MDPFRHPVAVIDMSFESDATACAATLYRPTSADVVPCLVMGHGLAGTKDLALPAYAERFAQGGVAVLTFDYRHFGASDGEPRQLVHTARQQQDYRAAVRHVRGLPGIDPNRIALWGTSFSAGHAIVVAVTDPTIAAVVVQAPGLSASPGFLAGLLAAAAIDAARGLAGYPPRRVPVVGDVDDGALITDPEGKAILESLAGKHSPWRNEVALRGIVSGSQPRPGKLTMPLLVCVADHDRLTPPAAAWRAARRAPHGELRRYGTGHFEIYRDPTRAQVIADQLHFLRIHLAPRA